VIFDLGYADYMFFRDGGNVCRYYSKADFTGNADSTLFEYDENKL
jgi:hypothetical protein